MIVLGMGGAILSLLILKYVARWGSVGHGPVGFGRAWPGKAWFYLFLERF